MIIIVRGADFSANNIGQVVLPFEPIGETTAYLSAISINPTDNVKKGIDVFLRGVKSNLINTKIDRIYLPLLGSVDGGINLLNPSQENINLPSSGASYDANGVLFTTNYELPYAVNTRDFSYGAFNTLGVLTTTPKVLLSSPTSNWWLGRGISTSGTLSGIIVDGTSRILTTGDGGGASGLVMGAHNLNNQFFACMIDGMFAQMTPPTGLSTANSPLSSNLLIGGNIGANYMAGMPIGIFFTGTQALNESEMSIINTLINDLRASFL